MALEAVILKGYSGVCLIHGLTHRDHVCRLLAYVVLASSEKNCTTTIHCSICLQQETAIKKPQIMLRTAPNFSNSTNRVPAHSSRHQTSASFAGFLLKSEHSSPLSCSSFLLWGSPDESITECSKVLQLKDENV